MLGSVEEVIIEKIIYLYPFKTAAAPAQSCKANLKSPAL